jgi:hypothetical protein
VEKSHKEGQIHSHCLFLHPHQTQLINHEPRLSLSNSPRCSGGLCCGLEMACNAMDLLSGFCVPRGLSILQVP